MIRRIDGEAAHTIVPMISRSRAGHCFASGEKTEDAIERMKDKVRSNTAKVILSKTPYFPRVSPGTNPTAYEPTHHHMELLLNDMIEDPKEVRRRISAAVRRLNEPIFAETGLEEEAMQDSPEYTVCHAKRIFSDTEEIYVGLFEALYPNISRDYRFQHYLANCI